MKFKDFKKTDRYLNADVISFVDTNGEDCEDIDEVLDNMEVIDAWNNGGYLEIILD